MRDSVSNLSDDDFCRAVAGLVEADYIAGIGVFHPIGRPAPVLTYGVGTQLTGLGRRSIGRWENGIDTTGSDMDANGEERIIGPCVVCGTTDGVMSIFESRSFLMTSNGEGRTEIRTLPPVDLCDAHRMPAARGDIFIGW